MAEIKLNTALMTNMEVQNYLGRHGGTAVYSVKSTKSDQMYVLKHISVPESQRQVEALIFTGAAADHDAAQAYYQQVVADYQAELEQLEALSNSPNLDSFRSYEIKPKEDGVGFDVYLLSEYRTTLESYLTGNQMTQSSAVNLAMDLCNALTDLRAAGLIHRDVKPSNIYLSSQGHFMLGDLGLAKLEELKYCSMPESMLSPYSAPELFDLMASVNETVDLYAVGLILYRIYNGNHAPFEDEKTSAKSADKLRITGQELPAPMFADYEMAAIIQKACSFAPEERYATPDEMKQTFVEYMKRNQVGDVPVTPPIVADEAPVDLEAAEEAVEPVQFTSTEELDEDFKQNFTPDNEMLNALIESVHRDIDGDRQSPEVEEYGADDAAPPNRRKKNGAAKWLPTILVILLVLALAGGSIWYFLIRRDTLTIANLDAAERSVDSITVTIETQEDPSTFEVVCTDAYGNVFRQPYTGESNTFTDLAAGTQYTISIEGLNREHIEGPSSIKTSTLSTTNIISFTASREAVSEVELNLIVDGAEPEEWTLSYGPTGGEAKTKVFTGHSVVLTGLAPDTEYTVTLMDPSDIHLTGGTTLTCRTVPSVQITKFNVTLSSAIAEIQWEYEGTAPASWNVTTTGTEGYSNNQVVTENQLVLEDLKAGEVYTIVVTSDSMVNGASTHFTPNALVLTSLTAEVNETGGVAVTWTTEAETEDVQWLVVYTLDGADGTSAVEQTTENSVVLTDLIPNSTYSIEIQDASGEQVSGKTTTTITLPKAEVFNDYKFTSAYVSIWPRPAKENWTTNDLSGARNKFSPSEQIAFVCQANNYSNSDDTVTTLLVVRDADGRVVDHYVGEEVWNNMWTKDMYAGELLRTPQTPGTYTLEIYFNGKQVKTVDDITFTITG